MPNYGFAYLKNLNDDIAEAAKHVKPEYQEDIETEYRSNSHGLGFPVSDAPGTYELLYGYGHHREILRLVALGYKYIQVASILGITPTVVSYTVNSPLGRAFLDEIHEARTGSVKDVHNRLQEMSPLAAEIMLDIMNDGKSETNKLRAAEKVLEMTGQKAENQHMHLHTHLTPEQVEEVKRTANLGPKTVRENSEEVSDAEVLEEGS